MLRLLLNALEARGVETMSLQPHPNALGATKELMRIHSSALVALLGLIVTFTSGCAFGTRHATLTYPPDVKAGKVSTNTMPAGVHGRIVVLPFEDERADKRLVGHVRNGFGMKTAEVVSDQSDLGPLVTEAVRGECIKAGYEVVNPAEAAGGELPALSGSLTKAYCDAYLTYDGGVAITIRVKRAGLEEFKRSYEGKGSVGMNWGASGASYGRSLSLALVDAIEAMKRDLPTALKQ